MEKDLKTSSEILVNSGLNWDIERNTLYDPQGREIPGYKALQRSDNGLTLGIRSDQYMPFQNRQITKLVDEITGTGMAKYDSAGMYNDGKKVYFRVQVPDGSFAVNKGDICNTYLDIFNSNDGSSCLYIVPVIVRLVCLNGMTACKADNTKRVKARHTKGSLLHFEIDAKAILSDEIAFFKKYAIQAQAMAQAKMTKLELESFLFNLFDKDQNAKHEVSTRTGNAMSKMYQLASSGRGQDGNLTKWSAFNGVTEYIDHWSKTNAESRKTFANIGRGVQLREKAFHLLNG